jgi:SAM-dependent methyltransferase
MIGPSALGHFDDSGDGVSRDGVFAAVRDGYNAVYDVLGHSPTFERIWRTKAYGGEFAEAFAHIGFLTLSEARRMLDPLDVRHGSVLVDVACGAGGPGLWAARTSGASLIGVDAAAAGVAAARKRAETLGLEEQASFQRGTFEQTGLPTGTADGIMSVEVFQYAPDKRAALRELFRVLHPGGHLVVICFAPGAVPRSARGRLVDISTCGAEATGSSPISAFLACSASPLVGEGSGG